MRVADGEPDPPVLAVKAQQRLGDRQADQLGLAEADRVTRPAVLRQRVVDLHVFSAVTRVSRSASTRASRLDVGLATPILDTLTRFVT